LSGDEGSSQGKRLFFFWFPQKKTADHDSDQETFRKSRTLSNNSKQVGSGSSPFFPFFFLFNKGSAYHPSTPLMLAARASCSSSLKVGMDG